MLNRLSVNVLLKLAFGIMAVAIVGHLATSAWESWEKLRGANRISQVAESSVQLFTALHNLRVDSTSTYRDLSVDGQPGVSPFVQGVRTAEIKALNASVAALRHVEFPNGNADVAALEAGMKAWAALHAQSAQALTQAKASRPPNLAKEVLEQGTALYSLIEKISDNLANTVKLEDSLVDHLLEIKELAWVARDNGGDASLLISNAIGGLPNASDLLARFSANMARAETAWKALEKFSVGLPLPARFGAAVNKAKQDFFAAKTIEFRVDLLTKVLQDQKVEVTPDEWLRTSTDELGTLLAVAEVALDTVKAHAAGIRARAQQDLIVELSLLVVAALISGCIVLMITYRISRPLRMVRDVMAEIASGDFNVSLPKIQRRDEIGEIVTAVNTMVEQVRATIAGIKASAREVTNASGEIAPAPPICRSGRKSRRRAWKRPPPRWRKSRRRCARTPRTPSAPSSSAISTRQVGRPRRRSRRPRRSRPWHASRSRRARSPTSSASSTRSRGRPTCWRSMPRWKRRAPAKQAAASRWWRPKCAAWRSARRRPPRTSTSSSPTAAAR